MIFCEGHGGSPLISEVINVISDLNLKNEYGKNNFNQFIILYLKYQ